MRGVHSMLTMSTNGNGSVLMRACQVVGEKGVLAPRLSHPSFRFFPRRVYGVFAFAWACLCVGGFVRRGCPVGTAPARFV